MGTPEIAALPLQEISKNHEVVGLFCQPDKPVGRKRQLMSPAAKRKALELGIPVFQPSGLHGEDAFEVIRALSPDLIVVMAYGKLLPEKILNFPEFGCINAHASLLPAYRGAAPVQHAIMNGDTVTGVTVIQMDEGLDTGDILLSREVEILSDDDAISMFKKISPLSASLLLEVIELAERGKIIRVAQNEAKASRAPLLDKKDGWFDFSKDAKATADLVRGLCIWPTAYFETGGKTVKAFRAKFSNKRGGIREILSLKPLTVAAANGSVELLEVMPPSGKRMEGSAFAAGLRLKVGDKL